MKRLTSILLLVLIAKSLYSQDTITVFKDLSPTLDYGADQGLVVKLNKWAKEKTYTIQICKKDGSACSLLSPKVGIVEADMLEEDFTNRVKEIALTMDLGLTADKRFNPQLVDSLFTKVENFEADLHSVFESMKTSLNPPKTAEPKKKVHGQSKNPIADSGDGSSDADKDDADDDTPSILDNITFLSAANFDFSTKISASYLGLFNVFAPNIRRSRWGVMAGIERVNYGNDNINGNDSTNVEYFHQNIVNPLDVYPYYNSSGVPTDSVRIGASYHRQFNKYTFSASDVVWSFYIDPFFRLTGLNDRDKNTGIFLHGHLELLVNQWTRTANIQNLADTVLTNTQSNLPYLEVSPTSIVSNYNFLSLYFGTGLTFYLPLFGDTTTHLFIQPTLGFALNTPNFSQLNNSTIAPNPNGTYAINVINNNLRGFYLFKASFLRDISSKAQLAIGFGVRGQLPTTYPQYTAYIGLNIGITALTDLFNK